MVMVVAEAAEADTYPETYRCRRIGIAGVIVIPVAVRVRGVSVAIRVRGSAVAVGDAVASVRGRPIVAIPVAVIGGREPDAETRAPSAAETAMSEFVAVPPVTAGEAGRASIPTA